MSMLTGRVTRSSSGTNQSARWNYRVREHRADGQHHRDFGKALQLLVEAQHGLRHVRRGLDRVRRVRRRGGLAYFDLGPGARRHRDRQARARVGFVHRSHPRQRKAGGEDRQESGRMRQQRDAIDQGDQAQCEKFVQPDRVSVARAQMQDQRADPRAEQPADPQPAANTP